ncbi:MAG: N-acetylmuramic acid 6-phosphate etherase [archaeon GB-1867-005]|nr:N-acetylmuramic acid 6-phosphate etherase [Candidatus Culexmicrobium cathedralense]
MNFSEEEKRIFEELSRLETEQINPRAQQLSELPTIEVLKVINEEDKKVAYAIEKELPRIAEAVEVIVDAVRRGGKWIYVGAGTSGRLGVIDVAELLPTYNVGPETADAIIAGGPGAMFRPIEGAEDDEEMAVRELKARRLRSKDVVIGISASGRTPFVISALKYARKIGAKTVAITCVKNSPITRHADIIICPQTGPEVITGSTRMKAATAQKMILTMLSTAVMVRLGRVHGSLMVTLEPVSKKLIERAKRIIMIEAGVSYEEAAELLEMSGGNVTVAIVMAKAGVNREIAEKLLEASNNIPTRAIKLAEELKCSEKES